LFGYRSCSRLNHSPNPHPSSNEKSTHSERSNQRISPTITISVPPTRGLPPTSQSHALLGILPPPPYHPLPSTSRFVRNSPPPLYYPLSLSPPPYFAPPPPLTLPPHAHNNRTATDCSTRQSTPFQTSPASLRTIYNSRNSIPLWSRGRRLGVMLVAEKSGFMCMCVCFVVIEGGG